MNHAISYTWEVQAHKIWRGTCTPNAK